VFGVFSRKGTVAVAVGVPDAPLLVVDYDLGSLILGGLLGNGNSFSLV